MATRTKKGPGGNQAPRGGNGTPKGEPATLPDAGPGREPLTEAERRRVSAVLAHYDRDWRGAGLKLRDARERVRALIGLDVAPSLLRELAGTACHFWLHPLYAGVRQSRAKGFTWAEWQRMRIWLAGHRKAIDPGRDTSASVALRMAHNSVASNAAAAAVVLAEQDRAVAEALGPPPTLPTEPAADLAAVFRGVDRDRYADESVAVALAKAPASADEVGPVRHAVMVAAGVHTLGELHDAVADGDPIEHVFPGLTYDGALVLVAAVRAVSERRGWRAVVASGAAPGSAGRTVSAATIPPPDDLAGEAWKGQAIAALGLPAGLTKALLGLGIRTVGYMAFSRECDEQLKGVGPAAKRRIDAALAAYHADRKAAEPPTTPARPEYRSPRPAPRPDGGLYTLAELGLDGVTIGCDPGIPRPTGRGKVKPPGRVSAVVMVRGWPYYCDGQSFGPIVAGRSRNTASLRPLYTLEDWGDRPSDVDWSKLPGATAADGRYGTGVVCQTADGTRYVVGPQDESLDVLLGETAAAATRPADPDPTPGLLALLANGDRDRFADEPIDDVLARSDAPVDQVEAARDAVVAAAGVRTFGGLHDALADGDPLTAVFRGLTVEGAAVLADAVAATFGRRRWAQIPRTAAEPEAGGDGPSERRAETTAALPEARRSLMDDPAVNDFGVYADPERVAVPLPTASKCSAEVLLARGNDDVWRACGAWSMPKGGGGQTGLPSVSRPDEEYETRAWAIVHVCREIAEAFERDGHEKAAAAARAFAERHRPPVAAGVVDRSPAAEPAADVKSTPARRRRASKTAA